MKLALVALALGGTASLALLQRANDVLPPRPDSFWALSWFSYLTALGTAGGLWKIWREVKRDRAKEEKEALATALAPVSAQMTGMVTHYDGELQRIERVVEQTANNLRGAITQDINGWSRRIEVVERGQEAQDDFNESVVRFMGQSETDRRNLGERLEALTGTTDRRLAAMDGKMDRILEALVQLKGGRNP